MGKRADDFPERVKTALKTRAAFICSNPKCRKLTVAPSKDDDEKVQYCGIAAHIHAASEGGARYDPNQSPADRKSIQNAVFLCSNCASIVDKNKGADYAASLLKEWKKQHEQWVLDNLNKTWDPGAKSTHVNVESAEIVAVAHQGVINISQSAATMRAAGITSLTLEKLEIEGLNADQRPGTLVATAQIRFGLAGSVIIDPGRHLRVMIDNNLPLDFQRLAVLTTNTLTRVEGGWRLDAQAPHGIARFEFDSPGRRHVSPLSFTLSFVDDSSTWLVYGEVERDLGRETRRRFYWQGADGFTTRNLNEVLLNEISSTNVDEFKLAEKLCLDRTHLQRCVDTLVDKGEIEVVMPLSTGNRLLKRAP